MMRFRDAETVHQDAHLFQLRPRARPHFVQPCLTFSYCVLAVIRIRFAIAVDRMKFARRGQRYKLGDVSQLARRLFEAAHACHQFGAANRGIRERSFPDLE